MAKNPKKTKEAEVLHEKAVRELEELKQRLRAETSADMVVLRALMDAERQARGIEQAASDYAVGAEWRVAEAAREIDARERANARAAAEKAAAEAAEKADAQIAGIHADAERRRAEIRERFEARRAGYADRVFGLVTGAENE